MREEFQIQNSCSRLEKIFNVFQNNLPLLCFLLHRMYLITSAKRERRDAPVEQVMARQLSIDGRPQMEPVWPQPEAQ
jgi:hypothetical protein